MQFSKISLKIIRNHIHQLQWPRAERAVGGRCEDFIKFYDNRYKMLSVVADVLDNLIAAILPGINVSKVFSSPMLWTNRMFVIGTTFPARRLLPSWGSPDTPLSLQAKM
jgi:hypothetical protein